MYSHLGTKFLGVDLPRFSTLSTDFSTVKFKLSTSFNTFSTEISITFCIFSFFLAQNFTEEIKFTF